MFELPQKNIEAQYFSFSQDLAGYHISKIKLAISANQYFRHIRDRKPTAESVIKYSWDDKTFYSLEPHGLIQFKRGIHADYVYVDDPFQDPENQLNPTIIKKINEIFKSNILDMPNEPDGELHCAGCLDPDTDILLANGNFKKLKEITIKDKLIGYDFKQQKFVPQSVVACIDNGRQKTKRLRTGGKRDLQNIIATTNHPFFTREGWKEISELKVGDYIAVPAKIETVKENAKPSATIKEAEMLGYITAEGSVGERGGFSFCNQDPVLINRMKTLCDSLGYAYVFRKNDENREVDMGIKLGKGHSRHDIKERLGLLHQTARVKTIPDSIFNSSHDAIAAFLKGLYDGDGVCPNDDRNGTGIAISSEKLAWGVHYLQLQLGLRSTMSVAHKIGFTGKPVSMFGAGLQRSQQVRHFLKLTNAFAHRFSADRIRQLKKNRGDLIPLLVNEYTFASKECGWHGANNVATRETLRKSKHFEYLTENNLEWIQITAIEDTDVRPTLNLTTELKNFVANGFLTHNTPQTDEDFYFDKLQFLSNFFHTPSYKVCLWCLHLFFHANLLFLKHSRQHIRKQLELFSNALGD
ncbi:MAG: Replicative DNA helicase [Candidatus Woesebacteria bacterium GW2011_GWA1_40_45]|uniref:Replicative DNA helicase n=1 Tax=Candidatus Woesebacteria bacterium GW2011_GWA1_40_45 TaxID=1618554 RepID=A0A0G0VIG4_9BACT|nr:MAG: Replicative DNA helicase [Candidatus Woesebacteria bacterium GW2011_GWA1_40_45]